MADVLVLVDIQRDYFRGGRMPLVGPDDAAERAGNLLGHFRARGLPVIHVRHESLESDATFLVAGTPGAEFDSRVIPRAGEAVIVKHHPNSFLETDLRAEIERHPDASLVVAGMMTSMCVDATVRAASDLGYDVSVVADACAAPDLEFAGTHVAGHAVHAAFIRALGDAYADVVMTADVVSPPADELR
ncbi:cysteine hydrolase family protein [Terracoccus sp. 273MFTsu3.1]|uniref:cysteine hydrolase family protein n=1 Tax=Terracoccus sp. 273MFTsu3.1 TaxID=1172188 RepID=UPI0003621E35|nr:cysteine hydrolase family protein [Terracoccus sp. 273MFTsu3.1]